MDLVTRQVPRVLGTRAKDLPVFLTCNFFVAHEENCGPYACGTGVSPVGH